MADTFQLEVATPDRLLVNEQVIRCQVPGQDGYLGVLPDHAPLLGELGIGVLTYVDTRDHRFAIAIKHGFVEVYDNRVRVLADEAQRGQEIDVTQAEKDLRHSQDELINPNLNLDLAYALIAYRHAQARIDAANKAIHKQE